MKAEVKSKWVAALRSGDYEQAQAVLRSYDDKYCCLGVLCDVTHPEGWMDETTEDSNHTKCFAFALGAGVRMRRTATLPSALLAEAELTEVEQGELILMNDAGDSFDIIADYIEKEL